MIIKEPQRFVFVSDFSVKIMILLMTLGAIYTRCWSITGLLFVPAPGWPLSRVCLTLHYVIYRGITTSYVACRAFSYKAEKKFLKELDISEAQEI